MCREDVPARVRITSRLFGTASGEALWKLFRAAMESLMHRSVLKNLDGVLFKLMINSLRIAWVMRREQREPSLLST
jgi:hypothetical protein